MTKEALKDLLDAVEAAIQAGDWKVDGACDPDLAIRRAKEALANPSKSLTGMFGQAYETTWKCVFHGYAQPNFINQQTLSLSTPRNKHDKR